MTKSLSNRFIRGLDVIVASTSLPDRNVAEWLARVSGVQVDRGIAEGASVSLRGLSAAPTGIYNSVALKF